MITIKRDVNLKTLNTFGIEARCKYFVEINKAEDLRELFGQNEYLNSKKLIIGGGSNILFTGDFEGIVIKNNLKGIEILFEDAEKVIVKAGAGEGWHNFVLWAVEKKFYGIENLSLIPGCVGASPMQNIGAYGVEIKDVFFQLEAIDMVDGTERTFDKGECKFGYRDSIFKQEHKNRYFITSVTFELRKSARLNTSYGAINGELEKMAISQPSIKDISNAVINIRKSKLPDPEVLGNAGSFFKNPEVSKEKYEDLKKEFGDLVAYALEGGNYKLAAGWLIEKSGLKGLELNGAAVHEKQALVLVNKKSCKGTDVLALSEIILKEVQKRFGVKLEREVNII